MLQKGLKMPLPPCDHDECGLTRCARMSLLNQKVNNMKSIKWCAFGRSKFYPLVRFLLFLTLIIVNTALGRASGSYMHVVAAFGCGMIGGLLIAMKPND